MSSTTDNVVKGADESGQKMLEARRRLWLFSMPRTASNMFVQMMKGQSNIANVEYEFMFGAFFKAMEKYDLENLSEGEKAFIQKVHEEAFQTVMTKVQEAESEGKTVFAKEHTLMCLDRNVAYNAIYQKDKHQSSSADNDAEIDGRWTLHVPGESEVRKRTSVLMLPDDFLLSWLPVFLIRHPALVISSQYRVYKKAIAEDPLSMPSMPLSASFRWSRMIYDWYLKNGVPAKTLGNEQYQDVWPIILDADDVVRDKRVIDKFCHAAKLNPEEVMYTWPERSKEEVTQTMGKASFFLSTLISSTGINKDLHKHEIDIAEMELKWKEEFGDEVAAKMRKMSEDAMEDYEYLRSRRMLADDKELPN